METMLLGYPTLKKRLESEGKPVILLDTLQEVEKCVYSLPINVPLRPHSTSRRTSCRTRKSGQAPQPICPPR